MSSAPRFLLALLMGAAVFLAASNSDPLSEETEGPVLDAIRVERIWRQFPAAPGAAPHRVHRRLTLHGRGFRRAEAQPMVNFRFDDGRNVPSPWVEWENDRRVVAWVPEICRGTARVELRNPDGLRTGLIVDL